MPGLSSDIAVVIPAYGHCPYLPEIMDALLAQTLQPDEIILSHSGPGDPTPFFESMRDRVVLLHSDERLLAGAARNAGARRAASRYLAFLDADVVPEPDWLQSLHDALAESEDRVLVGAIDYRCRGGYWGLSSWAAEFSGVHPYMPYAETTSAASANMAVAACHFWRAGAFPEGYQPGEDTVLVAELRRLGLKHWFVPSARGGHCNVPGLTHFVRQHFRLGKRSAVCRRRYALRGHAAARYPVLIPLLWGARLLMTYGRAFRWGARRLPLLLVLMPGVVAAHFVWNVGFVAGMLVPSDNARFNKQMT